MRTLLGAPEPGGVRPEDAPAEQPAPAAHLADLDGLPVAEHVAVFETEHARLQRELGTIDGI